jgi:hypothetical protein
MPGDTQRMCGARRRAACGDSPAPGAHPQATGGARTAPRVCPRTAGETPQAAGARPQAAGGAPAASGGEPLEPLEPIRCSSSTCVLPR